MSPRTNGSFRPPVTSSRRSGDAGSQGATMASPTSLPADVLAAIAKQRGKNKAPTMTAEEIAKHRWGNRNGTSTLGLIVRPGAPGVGRWRADCPRPLSLYLMRARPVTVLLGATTPSSGLCAGQRKAATSSSRAWFSTSQSSSRIIQAVKEV